MFSFLHHEDDDFFPASESQNCLTEAVAFRQSLQASEDGEGDIAVEVISSYYCRSTDAFAGNYVSHRQWFTDYDAAQVWVAEQPHGDDYYEFVPPLPRPLLPPPPATINIDDDDVLPF